MVEESRSARYLAEFIGTLLLTFTVGCNALSDKYIWGSTSNAATLMVLIYAFGEISGAHFNPAVTIAAFISRRLSVTDFVVYCIMQVFGALCGALMYAVMFWQTFNLAPKPGFTWFQAGLCELLYTGMLCFVVLNCAIASRKGNGQFAGLAIGFVLIAAGNSYGAGAVSGAVLNPAIAFAIDITSLGLGFGWSMAYIGWQLMGTAIACVLFRLCRPLEFGTVDMVILVEPKIGQETRFSMLLAEFLGTFMLTITVGLNVLCLSRAGAWSIACALMSMIYSLADVSGAQFNPAVTLAVVASGRYDFGVTSKKKGAMFMGVQFLAGIVGAWMFVLIYSGQTFSLGPVDAYTWGSRIPIEIFFTFVLCLTVLSVATARGPKDDILGFAVGMCIVVGGYVVSMVSGGTMNPAVTFGVATTSVRCTNCISFWWSLLYILLEFAGAILAAAIFALTRPGEFPMTLKPSNLLPEYDAREFQVQKAQDGTSTAFSMSPPQRPPVTGPSLGVPASSGMSAHPAMAGPYSMTGQYPAPARISAPGSPQNSAGSAGAQQAVLSPFAVPTGSMGPQMPGLTMSESSTPAEVRAPPVYSMIQADDYVNLSGTPVAIFKEYQLSAMHAHQLREYAFLLSRLIGPGHASVPESDAALMAWILQMQKIYLLPLKGAGR